MPPGAMKGCWNTRISPCPLPRRRCCQVGCAAGAACSRKLPATCTSSSLPSPTHSNSPCALTRLRHMQAATATSRGALAPQHTRSSGPHQQYCSGRSTACHHACTRMLAIACMCSCMRACMRACINEGPHMLSQVPGPRLPRHCRTPGWGHNSSVPPLSTHGDDSLHKVAPLPVSWWWPGLLCRA
jgi:hypothetical protein